MRKVVEIMNTMSSNGCTLDNFTYNTWINGLRITKMINFKLLDSLTAIGIIPNVVAYNTILNGL